MGLHFTVSGYISSIVSNLIFHTVRLFGQCLACRQNVIKHTPATARSDREGEGERRGREGGRRAPLPPKFYKTHACTGGQRERGEGGRRV